MEDLSSVRSKDCLGTNETRVSLYVNRFQVQTLRRGFTIIKLCVIYRDTAVGKFFFKAIATKESVKNILCQVLF